MVCPAYYELMMSGARGRHGTHTIAVHPQTMIVRLFRQLFLGILLCFLHDFSIGPDIFKVNCDCMGVGVLGRWDVRPVARNSRPAELFDLLFGHCAAGCNRKFEQWIDVENRLCDENVEGGSGVKTPN
jgi:hypothetical protein